VNRPAVEPIAVDIEFADIGLSAVQRRLLESRVADEVMGLIQDLSLPPLRRCGWSIKLMMIVKGRLEWLSPLRGDLPPTSALVK